MAFCGHHVCGHRSVPGCHHQLTIAHSLQFALLNKIGNWEAAGLRIALEAQTLKIMLKSPWQMGLSKHNKI